MASALYDSYKQDLLDRNKSIDLETNTIECALVTVTAGYTFDTAHDFRDDLGANVVEIAADTALGSKTVANGVFDAGDLTYTTVTGNDIEALVLYKNVGTPATDDLVCFIDGFTGVTPNGGDITVTWGANIFSF